MSTDSEILYEQRPEGLPGNIYAPWDLTLRVRIADDKGCIEVQANYHDGPGELSGSIDDATFAATKIQLDPVIQGCLQSWERAAGTVATANGQTPELGWSLTSHLTQNTREIIRRGQALYRAVFGPADDGSDTVERQRLRGYLAQANARPLRILILSDSLYVPWNLLYIDGRLAGNAPDFINGFLGFRHQLVQKVTPRHALKVKEFGSKTPIIFSKQCDTTLPIHYELDQYLASITKASLQIVDRDHDAFTQTIQAGTCNDDILYFCCHGQRAQTNEDQPKLFLTPNTKLYPTDITDLMLDQFFTYQPLVLINACFAGELGETLFNAFGPAFLSRGASTILAPAVTIPRKYAAKYAKSVFEEVFKGVTSAGEEHETKIATIADAIARATRQSIRDRGELLALLYGTVIRRSVHMPHQITPTQEKSNA